MDGISLGGNMSVSENSGFSLQIIHFNRLFHYFHHPFWGFSPILGNTHIDGVCLKVHMGGAKELGGAIPWCKPMLRTGGLWYTRWGPRSLL